MTGGQPKFHFSPRPNRAPEIRWRGWGPDAFAEAANTGKPVLLALSAVWCHWCHVMDETSYSDADVIGFINENYIPVRVDNDQRPDINARYNMGGWPTTAFLTPEGEVLAGATYVPPDQMKELLPQVAAHYRDNRDEVSRKAAGIRERRAALGVARPERLTSAVFDTVLRSVIDGYDPVYGGFGEAPKFPHADAIDLLLYAYRRDRDPDVLHVARKTLESMARGGVFDHEWGGFFRYATKRDWSEPHYEKMLEDNANLLHCLLALYRITGDAAHAEFANGTIGYVEDKLRDRERGFFYGSQDADEAFYGLSAAEREGRDEPYIDRTCYTSWNAMAVSAYLEASWTLDRPELREAALTAIEFLWAECRAPDASTAGSGQGMYRFHDGTSGRVQGILADQAYTALALLDAHEVSGDSKHLERAVRLADFMSDRFAGTGSGGFYDVWDGVEGLGRLGERQRPPQENAVCAEVFLRLHYLTREEEYRRIAEDTLEAFAGVYQNLGRFAAGYARMVDLFLNKAVEVNIVGYGTAAAALHWAALRLDVPSRVVQVLNPVRDAGRLETLALKAAPAPAAYVCAGKVCSAPVTEPEGLAQAARDMQGMRPSP